MMIMMSTVMMMMMRLFSFLGLVHFCNNLVRKCTAVSAYNSAAAGSMCRDVAFAVEAHRGSPRKPTSFLAASRGRDGSPVVARVRCIFALLSRENAPL